MAAGYEIHVQQASSVQRQAKWDFNASNWAKFEPMTTYVETTPSLVETPRPQFL